MMILLTLVYVVATIIICYFNFKTIVEQHKINQEQKQLSAFSLRYETYKYIAHELHFWRFSNNDQVLEFFSMKSKSDIFMCLASHNQNFYDLLVRTNLIFGEYVYKQIDEAWKIIRKEIYPHITDIVKKASTETTPTDILIQIKYKMQEDPLRSSKYKLFIIEAELTAIIEDEIQIRTVEGNIRSHVKGQ